MTAYPSGTAAGGAPPAGAGRPGQVTAAGVLLLLVPVLSVVGLGLILIALTAAQDNGARVADELARDGYFDPQGTVDGVLASLWLQLGLNTFIKLIQAVGFGVLAFVVLRGSPAGRIIVYALAGLTVLGSICFGGLDALRLSLYSSLEQAGEEVLIAYVDERDLLPGWYLLTNYALIAVSVVVILTVVWLLTRPAANAYFGRDRRPPWAPPPAWSGPVPGPGQPWPPQPQHPYVPPPPG